MKVAVDWVNRAADPARTRMSTRERLWQQVFLCGGIEAVNDIWDTRVDSVGVVNSGLLVNTSAAREWRKPGLVCTWGAGGYCVSECEF